MTIYERIWRRARILYGRMTSVVAKIQFRLHGIRFGKGIQVRGYARVYNEGMIEIGEDCRFNSSFWSNPIGAGDKMSLNVKGTGRLLIGDNCAISNTAFTVTCEVIIEDYVFIGSGCRIWDTDFHALELDKRMLGNTGRSQAIRIESGAFIGAGCTILKGVTVGRCAVIGANSVVTKSVPDNEIWAGNPARCVRKL